MGDQSHVVIVRNMRARSPSNSNIKHNISSLLSHIHDDNTVPAISSSFPNQPNINPHQLHSCLVALPVNKESSMP